MASKLWRKIKTTDRSSVSLEENTSLPLWDRSTLHSYRYSPLGDDEIRLLVIQPGKADADIHCKLEHVPVAGARDYAAISYVWGDVANSCLIYIEGKFVQVTRNLWLILNRVRRLEPDSEFAVWADAVSINQQDRAEKSRQILLMPQIYPNSNQVLTWLGEDDGTIGIAFKAFWQWYEAQEDSGKLLQLVQRFSAGDDEITKIEISAMSRVFQREYWKRAWILQEPVQTKSGRHPSLMSGMHDLPWWIFYQACYTLFSSVATARLFQESLVHIQPILRVYTPTQENASFSRPIPLAASRESTMLVDKIFSLHGIAARNGVDYPAPNYEWSVETAFAVYTRATIMIDKSLAILHNAAPAKEGSASPTWSIKPHQIVSERGNAHGERYCAMLKTIPSLKESQQIEDKILTLQGIPFDRIVQTVTLASFLRRIDSGERTWQGVLVKVDEFAGLLKLPEMYSSKGESRATAMLRTLLGDAFLIDQDLALDSSLNFEPRERLYNQYQLFRTSHAVGNVENKEEFYAVLNERFDFRDPKKRGALQREAEVEKWLDKTITGELVEAMNVWSMGRYLVLTQEGRVGLAPDHCAKGDEIVGLYGGRMPFVLRPTQSELYELVGEGYLHGTMYGEMMPESEGPPGSSRVTKEQTPKMYALL